MNVRQILEFLLARTGLKIEVKSQSSVITGYYPDFTVLLNNRGDAIIRKLLSFVPDVLFIEGNKACLVNPLASDNSVYSYGQSHPLLEGRYLRRAWGLNRIQVEGYDSGSEEPIIVDSFSWEQIAGLYDRIEQLEDRNIDTVAKAGQRGEAYLREAEIESDGGTIRVPVNCGQQLYDVISITDSRAGLTLARSLFEMPTTTWYSRFQILCKEAITRHTSQKNRLATWEGGNIRPPCFFYVELLSHSVVCSQSSFLA